LILCLFVTFCRSFGIHIYYFIGNIVGFLVVLVFGRDTYQDKKIKRNSLARTFLIIVGNKEVITISRETLRFTTERSHLMQMVRLRINGISLIQHLQKIPVVSRPLAVDLGQLWLSTHFFWKSLVFHRQEEAHQA